MRRSWVSGGSDDTTLSDMYPVLRAHGPADLISLVPALLGFRPRESLVAVATHGPRSRLGFRLRIDLPDPDHAEAAAEQVVAYLLRQQPDEVLLVAFSDRPDVAGPLVTAVRDRLGHHDVPLHEALRCDGARYWSYLCSNEWCCPPAGSPYDDRSNAVLAEAVFHGLEVLPDRDALVERYARVTGAARTRMCAATAGVQRAYEALVGAGHPGRDPRVLRAGLDQVMAVVDAFEAEPERVLSDTDVATLSVWASLLVVRDCLWARITRASAPTHLAMWTQASARVVEPYEPAVLTLTAFAGWLSGSGSVAQCALDRAADADPHYSMAGLVQTALTGCLDPAVWEGLDLDEVMRTVPGLT